MSPDGREENTPMKKHAVILVSLGIAALGLALFAWFAMWPGLTLSVKLENVAGILAPLILTAAFIERAVEVVISPWRDPEADKLHSTHTAALSSSSATTDEKSTAKSNLDAYKGKTKQYAFAALLAFGLVAAMVGVRALWPFLDEQSKTVFNNFSSGQRNTFFVFDVVLSAALMAGGANGIHSLVSAITAFSDATAQKTQQSVNS
jgi:hypothetical protein